MSVRILLVCAVFWSVSLAGCIFGFDEDHIPYAHIEMSEGEFKPWFRIIAVDDTVIWKNQDDVPHQVISDQGVFSSGYIQPGASWQFQFNETGDFRYHCPDHANWTGERWKGMSGIIKSELPEGSR